MNAPCRWHRDSGRRVAERYRTPPIMAASGTLFGLSFQTALLKLPGWLIVAAVDRASRKKNNPFRPSACRFQPIPFVFHPESVTVEIRNGKFSLSLGHCRGRGLARLCRNWRHVFAAGVFAADC